MKVAIIVDSACGLTQAQAARKKWFFLPLYFTIDSIEYKDGIDIQSETLFNFLTPESTCSTSSTPLGQAVELVEKLIAEQYDKIVIYPISAGLSSQYNNLTKVLEQYPQVNVVKSNKVSVLTLIDLINFENDLKNGVAYEQAFAKMEKDLHGRFILIPKFNDFLVKGGRLTPAAAAIAKLLKIVPVIELRNGKLESAGKGRIFSKTVTKYFNEVASEFPNYKRLIVHSRNKNIDEFVEHFKNVTDVKVNDVPLFPIPGVISVHTGIEAVAFGVLDINDQTFQELMEITNKK
ncbi:DegV family protein [Candidatus Mycoplasma pogonae]